MRSSLLPVLGGFAVATVAFLAMASSAQAATSSGPLTVSLDLGAEVLGLVDDMARTVVHGGGAFLDGLGSIGSAFGLETHEGDATHCQDLRGVGFAFLGLAAVVMIAIGRMRLATEQRRLDLARRLIERGIELPAGLLTAPARRDLRKGVVLVFAGLGLVVAGMMLGDRGMAAGGLIPAFIGIGYLVSHRLAQADDDPGAGPPSHRRGAG